jgi:hypothetical protein
VLVSASVVDVPYESVVPYSTCDDPCSSVSHVIVAPVAVIFELVTEEIVGAVVSLTAF